MLLLMPFDKQERKGLSYDEKLLNKSISQIKFGLIEGQIILYSISNMNTSEIYDKPDIKLTEIEEGMSIETLSLNLDESIKTIDDINDYLDECLSYLIINYLYNIK